MNLKNILINSVTIYIYLVYIFVLYYFKMKKLQNFFEEQAFGVCARLGEKFKIPSSSIRISFIYASFLTFGSPVILYLVMAFIMNFRKHLRRRHNVWYY